MRRQHVRTPKHNELRETERLWIHADLVVAKCVAGPEPPSNRAKVVVVARSAEHVPQSPPGTVDALDQSHTAAAGNGPDSLSAVARDHVAETLCDLVECLIP